ncbi:MAG: 1,2-phenylacetyl-CoA epoxidase subunit PaaC [Anaerolineae bacterium]|nr:1,2-phenylacetyl-CoA epoxidase subunit PaaC [Anaerolineae bacterium]
MPATPEKVVAPIVLAMADDELILGHRNSEWTGHAPILEEDIAFANIALDELGHARLWYDLHSTLTDTSPDTLVFFRPAGDYRNVRLVELPRGDWAFTMLRQYLFDAFELVRGEQLLESTYRPLAEIAARILPEERYHYRHTETWVRRLGLGTAESHSRTQLALDVLWPYAAQLFGPWPAGDKPSLAGIVPGLAHLRERWEALVLPFLADAGLKIPTLELATAEGRDVHTTHLAPLLQEMQEVARLDPEATW